MTLFWFCFVLVGLIMPNILIGVLSNAYVHSERSYLGKRGAARVRPFVQVAIEFFYNSVRNAPFFVLWKMRGWRLAALRPRFDAEYAKRGKITSNTRRLFLQSYEVTRLLATFVDPLGGVLLPVEDMQRLLVSVDDDDSLATSVVIENFVRSFSHDGVAGDVHQLQTLRFTDARLLACFVAQCIRPAERVIAALETSTRRRISGLGVQVFDPTVNVVEFADMLLMLARDEYTPPTSAHDAGTTNHQQAEMLRGAHSSTLFCVSASNALDMCVPALRAASVCVAQNCKTRWTRCRRCLTRFVARPQTLAAARSWIRWRRWRQRRWTHTPTEIRVQYSS
jgi:hypothetical protein